MAKVHFLNVGHGDCTVIEHASGRLTVIDINNGDELDNDSQTEVLAELAHQRRMGLVAAAMTNSPAQLPAGGLSGLGLNQPRSLGVGLRNSPVKLGALAGIGLASPGVGSGGILARGGFGALPKIKSKTDQLKDAGYSIDLTNPIAHIKAIGKPVFRYIQTHPDLDHMRGLATLKAEGLGITNFWDTKHQKKPDFNSDSDKEHWQEYQRLRIGNGAVTVLQLYRDHKGVFWNQEPESVNGGDGIEILAPTPDLIREAIQAENWNNLSYVLRVNIHGITAIFGGDAEEEVWEDIVKRYGAGLKCDVLKASHHGRDSGYHQKAVELMSPKYTIVSVGKKPDTDASNKYRACGSKVWSTRWKGNITIDVGPEGKGKIFPQIDR